MVQIELFLTRITARIVPQGNQKVTCEDSQNILAPFTAVYSINKQKRLRVLFGELTPASKDRYLSVYSHPTTMKVRITMGTGIKTRGVWIGWIVASMLLVACCTTGQEDPKTRPRVQAIGHGTTPGSSWAGVGINIPFPGQSAKPSSSSSGQDFKE
jgi:hypothetical protein